VKFFVDHDVPAEIERILLSRGHEVMTVREALHETASDDDVFLAAKRAGAILVTCNRDDFLKLAQGTDHVGLIILIRRKARIAECAALLKLIERAGASGLARNINFA
jgi:predicted nuclease of predicted toxin-antitoxin system